MLGCPSPVMNGAPDLAGGQAPPGFSESGRPFICGVQHEELGEGPGFKGLRFYFFIFMENSYFI